MLYSEIIAVCSQIHIEHINTMCGKNVELVNVKHAPSRKRQITLGVRSSLQNWGSTVGNLLQVTLLVPRIWRWLVDL
jgi:hypothetical protein